MISKLSSNQLSERSSRPPTFRVNLSIFGVFRGHGGVFAVAGDGAWLQVAASQPAPGATDLPPGVPDPLRGTAPASPGDSGVSRFEQVAKLRLNALGLPQ